MANGHFDFLLVDKSVIGKHIDPLLNKKFVERKLAFVEKPNLPTHDKISQYIQDV
jgi:hypothetical protein